MVHADATNFVSNMSKQEAYAQVLSQARGLFHDQRNWVCNLSNAASLLWHCLHALPFPSNQTNWAGFYVVDPAVPNQLILGPFQGKVACQTIRFGRGVCGVAAKMQETQIVGDVDAFPGHIACDSESKSEIVVPVVQDGKVVAIIDVDCTVNNGFDQEDKDALDELARLIADSCDF